MVKSNGVLEAAACLALMSNPMDVQEAPEQAFFLPPTGHLQFEASGEVQSQERPIRLLARTGDPIDHWYWGRIVHDFAGMQHKDKVAFDWCHDRDEIIGYGDKFDSSTGDLWIDGKLLSLEVGDEADKMIKLGEKGVPYEGSIYFTDARLEWLPDGMSTQVNGREVSGPLVIAREWTLRRVACCPSGADGGTEVSFSSRPKSEGGTVQLQWKGKPMTKADNPAEGELSPDKQKPATPPNDPHQQFRAELGRFTAKFGPKGAEYFQAGLSWEAALEKHVEELSAERDGAVKAKSEAEQKLAALNLGEREPIQSATAPGNSKATSFDAAMNGARQKARERAAK